MSLVIFILMCIDVIDVNVIAKFFISINVQLYSLFHRHFMRML